MQPLVDFYAHVWTQVFHEQGKWSFLTHGQFDSDFVMENQYWISLSWLKKMSICLLGKISLSSYISNLLKGFHVEAKNEC